MVFIGTSGFLYWGWRGILYPQDSKPSEWLKIYSQNFNALEINSTFYRLPVKSSLRNYRRKVPELKLVLKLFRGITHYRKLTDENLSPFLTAKEILKDQLFCLLAQFPKSFKPSEKSFDFIRQLIERLNGIEVVFELRHPDWQEHFDELKKLSVPVCCSDFPEKLGWLKECIETEKITYFRFHGRRKLYNDSYTDEELKEIAQKVKSKKSRYKLCFFNNTSHGYAVINAMKLKSLQKCC